jgi:hypothetical protein
MNESDVANESSTRFTMGAIVASAVVAALVAFFLRRAMRSEEEHIELSQQAIKERATAATGEFVRAYLAPELKPMALTVLRDVREYVDRGFQRAEEKVKDL